MSKYFIYLLLFITIIFRGIFINIINNINKNLISKNNVEINILKEENNNLLKEYNDLLSFKNNININENYIITNIYKNNYGFDKLLINGTNYNINNEVITEKGLIGIISKIYKNYSEIKYIYNTNLPVIINGEKGKITGKDNKNNLIISELSNYNNININDSVYSTYGTYIGKVIDKKVDTLDTTLIVSSINVDKINYVGVITRYDN